jgi:hypothetical protein
MSPKQTFTATLVTLTTSLGLASAAVAAPVWTSQDDLEYVYSFSQAYAARTGFLPDPALVQASLTCVRGTYNQLAALGSDPVSAIQYAATTCQSQFIGQGTANGSNRSGTLFNSSGDSSLSTDSNGCMYYSGSSFSSNYSFSTC